MVDQSGGVLWAVLVAPVLVLLAGTVLRPVLPGRQVLVVRGARVRRVVRRGLAARMPVLDRFVAVDPGPFRLTAPVRARTRDGRDAVVLVEAGWRSADWPAGAPYTPSAAAVEDALADRLVAAVADLGVEDLPHALADRLDEIGADVTVPGAADVRVELAEVNIVLRTDAGADGSR